MGDDEGGGKVVEVVLPTYIMEPDEEEKYIPPSIVSFSSLRRKEALTLTLNLNLNTTMQCVMLMPFLPMPYTVSRFSPSRVKNICDQILQKKLTNKE
jgi:hypothetical protein